MPSPSHSLLPPPPPLLFSHSVSPAICLLQHRQFSMEAKIIPDEAIAEIRGRWEKAGHRGCTAYLSPLAHKSPPPPIPLTSPHHAQPT